MSKPLLAILSFQLSIQNHRPNMCILKIIKYNKVFMNRTVKYEVFQIFTKIHDFRILTYA